MLVTNTEGSYTRTMLDNILCGIMYRFRVRAFNEIGSSVPGIPSDAFVIDTPGVHIAPYFILCPPADTTRSIHQTVQFRAKALGTPKPNILWQKDEEPIFITEGIDIQEEPDGSVLTVHNLQADDNGVIQCIAVNPVGKAIASTNLAVVALPKFKRTGGATDLLQFTFRAEEMIRLKFPFVSHPPAELSLVRGDRRGQEEVEEAEVGVREDHVLFRVETARAGHSGHYTILADNGEGEDRLEFYLDVEVPPESPGCPEITELSSSGQLRLEWSAPVSSPVDHYIIEYYRDQWQLWLRLKTTMDTAATVTDLIPGSKYKFRILSASLAGISDPSQPSEEVMVGAVADDELFDLPSYGRGRSTSRVGKRFNKMPSLERNSGPPLDRRQTSLDREVYYDSHNVRKEVVTYKPPEPAKLGTLSSKYKMSGEELNKYKTSMSELCHRMKAISNSSLVTGKPQSNSVDATQPLKREVLSQARRFISASQILKAESAGYIDGETSLGRSSSSSFLARQAELSNDVTDCKKSLTDIRDRIGSLQSLLAQSRTLTTSRQQLLSEVSTTSPTSPTIHSQADKIKKANFASNRNDSYSRAMDDNNEKLQVGSAPLHSALPSALH